MTEEEKGANLDVAEDTDNGEMENGDFKITISSLFSEKDCSPNGNYDNGEMENGDFKITIKSLFSEKDCSPDGNYDNGEMENGDFKITINSLLSEKDCSTDGNYDNGEMENGDFKITINSLFPEKDCSTDGNYDNEEMENGDFKITINSLFSEKDCSPDGNYDNGEMENGDFKITINSLFPEKDCSPVGNYEAQTLDALPYAESSTAAERRLAEGEGEIQEEPQEGDRMTPEPLNPAQDPIFSHEAQTLDAPPYAESLTAAERRQAEGEGEIQEEPQEGDRTTPESLNQEQDPIFNYACSLVKNVRRKCFIHKVHSGLRDGSDKHYEPVLVSIGPYHHGKPPVQDMEKYKIHYTEVLLCRVKEKGIDRYKKALEDEEEEPRALDCYRDTHKMQTDSFTKSMVHDGCFMIELFRRNKNPNNYEDSSNDILFNIRWMKPRLERDMLLFENQIPLLVLYALFSLTEQTTDEGKFVPLVLKFFEFNGKPIPYDANLTNWLDDIPHLLGLVYKALVSSEEEKDSAPGPPGKLNGMWTSLKSYIWTVFVRLIEKTFRLKTAQQLNNERKSCEFIRTAVALEQVGVTFVRVEDNVTFYDIKFSSGVLSIPRLVIDDNTESFFRNLVAYEQYSQKNSLHRVVDYLHVMDCLINTSKDVEVLRHCGIIDNRIGDDAKVSTMFNCLCSDVYFNQDDFFYKEMFLGVNKFCMDRTNAWKATLKNEYFGSPWSVISFIAAVLLLLLTATQTVYSVLSYVHSSSSGTAGEPPPPATSPSP